MGIWESFSPIEIINNTKGGIVIFISVKKGNMLMGSKFKSWMQEPIQETVQFASGTWICPPLAAYIYD